MYVPLPDDQMAGRQVSEKLQEALGDRFEIEAEIGRGGTAVVFRAHDNKHDRPVALKVLRPQLAMAVGPQRFLREIKLCARLQHPHILGLYDSGEAGGFLYYVMALLEGDSLRSRIDVIGTLPIGEALRVAREIADALDFAHEQKIIHRDIKPENIMFQDDHAVITDFGVARAIDAAAADRLTATGEAVGTPIYMSPEQAQGDRAIDGRADIYALGCIVYEMLTGSAPFTGPNAQSIVRQHIYADPPVAHERRADVSPGISEAICRALAKDVGDRFSTAAAFVGAMEGADPAPSVGGVLRRLTGFFRRTPSS